MTLTVAAVQMAMVDDVDANVATAERLVRDAHAGGAQVVLIPELFEGPYFCKDIDPEHFGRARPVDGHPTVEHFRAVAAELGVVLPLSIYERAGQATFNTVVVVDADGAVLGTYRKSHIPDGPGYSEKYYFNGGDTGFRVWATAYATIGVGICWDQWFPESARAMALLGAEVLLFPTAIGSEPPDPTWDSSGHWQRVMQGHAGANLMPLVAANRVGHEVGTDDRDHVLRLVVHRRRHRRQGRRGRPHERGCDQRLVRARRAPRPTARVGPVPRSPARPVRPAAHPRRHHPLAMSVRARMPAETGRHERTVMCWPARASLYGGRIAEARAAHAEVAATIARFEPVTMIADPASSEAAATACGGDVEVVELAIDDSWFRDTGPIYVIDGDGTRVALDFEFNSWGAKFTPFDADVTIARRWAAHAGHPLRSVAMVLEGGAIAVDGDGTLVTTEQCLLHPNRNPALTRVEVEAVLGRELGVTTVVWLPFGLALDADTDGHVDNVAAFVRPGTLLVQGCADEGEDDWLRCNVNARSARGALDAAGRALDVIDVPVLPYREVEGVRVAVPYLNYYVVNGGVIVPVCGHDADDDMLAIIAAEHPGREVVGVDVGAILAYGGGGIHCITQQVPAA